MAIERTLSIIKPNAVEKGYIGRIIEWFEREGFRVAAMRMIWMSKREAEGFYAEHKGKGFFNDLTDFMSRGPAVVMVLEGEDAIMRNREVMGATDPAKAAPDTIRDTLGKSLTENTVHGSDSQKSAAREIAYFFPEYHIY